MCIKSKCLTRILAVGFVLTTALPASAQAKAKIAAYVELGTQGSQLMQTVGPEELSNQTEENPFKLKRFGKPIFFPLHPEYYATKGAGSLAFDGKADQYCLDRALVPDARRFVLEAWAMASKESHKGLHAVVAHGDGARGWMIAQQEDRWVVFIGGQGPVAFGKVVPEQWEHLAAVYDSGQVALYQNGVLLRRQSAGFRGLNANFSVGGVGGHNREGFAGRICSVRLSTFSEGAFDPVGDLMLDHEKIAKDQAKELRARQKRIDLLLDTSGVERVKSSNFPRQKKDWLIHRVDEPVRILAEPLEDGTRADITLTNGLVSRTFHVADNLACISYRNLSNEAEYVRSVQPEARIQLDGAWYDVGGLQGQKLKAYLMRDWLVDLHDDGKGFQFVGIETGAPKERYSWKPRYNSGEHAWPPKGKRVTMTYRMADSAPPEHRGTMVKVHYELYNGAPVMCKYIDFINTTKASINVDRVETEILAMQQDQVKRIHMESDYSCALFNRETGASDTQHLTGGFIEEYCSQGTTTKWRVEKDYHFYATHNQAEDKFLDFPHRNVLVCTIPVGPDVTVAPGESFTPMHSFELLHDSDDTERRSLGQRHMYRLIAPQVNEHLISAFISTTELKDLKPYIDQASELGFESLSLQWPSVRIAHDRLDDDYVNRFKEIADYARSKRIGLVGAYELAFASRGRGAPNNVVHPETKKPGGFFGQSACLGSEWMQGYSQRTLEFFDKTGFKMWEIDGPYHGEPCASDKHPGHKGLKDSQYQQWRTQVELIHQLLKRDVYIPIPDWYFLVGQSVMSMGYREAAAGLSANLQLLLYRQYIYDGTWFKTNTMGWIEFDIGKLKPYKENLAKYERWLIQGLGCGARINWRGRHQFYDTEETKAMVKGWFDWFRRHRAILNSDIIHLARPSGRDVDAIFHVNPHLEERGLAVLFNPLDEPMEKELRLPLYYTGIEEKASISVHTDSSDGGVSGIYTLDRERNVNVTVKVPPQGHVWLLIKKVE